jgi:hypothetical protein
MNNLIDLKFILSKLLNSSELKDNGNGNFCHFLRFQHLRFKLLYNHRTIDAKRGSHPMNLLVQKALFLLTARKMRFFYSRDIVRFEWINRWYQIVYSTAGHEIDSLTRFDCWKLIWAIWLFAASVIVTYWNTIMGTKQRYFCGTSFVDVLQYVPVRVFCSPVPRIFTTIWSSY